MLEHFLEAEFGDGKVRVIHGLTVVSCFLHLLLGLLLQNGRRFGRPAVADLLEAGITLVYVQTCRDTMTVNSAAMVSVSKCIEAQAVTTVWGG
jgi:hypothetical protein